jgi:hypothetical protein
MSCVCTFVELAGAQPLLKSPTLISVKLVFIYGYSRTGYRSTYVRLQRLLVSPYFIAVMHQYIVCFFTFF